MKKIYSKPTDFQMEVEAYIFKNAFKKTNDEFFSKSEIVKACLSFAIPIGFGLATCVLFWYLSNGN